MLFSDQASLSSCGYSDPSACEAADPSAGGIIEQFWKLCFNFVEVGAELQGGTARATMERIKSEVE